MFGYEDELQDEIALLKAENEKLKFRLSVVIKSLHSEILNVIMENGFLIKQENWSIEQQEIRATYDSFRIINLVNDKLSNVL